MAGSASSQHASAPLGATAHLFNPGTETGEGSGVSLTEVGRLVPTGAAAFESDSTTGRCGIASADRDSLKTRMVRAADARLPHRERQEQARQTEHGLAVGAHLAFGVLEGLVLIGAARLEHASVLVQGGACTSDADDGGKDSHAFSLVFCSLLDGTRPQRYCRRGCRRVDRMHYIVRSGCNPLVTILNRGGAASTRYATQRFTFSVSGIFAISASRLEFSLSSSRISEARVAISAHGISRKGLYRSVHVVWPVGHNTRAWPHSVRTGYPLYLVRVTGLIIHTLLHACTARVIKEFRRLMVKQYPIAIDSMS